MTKKFIPILGIDVSDFLFISNKNNKNIDTIKTSPIILLTAIYNKDKSIFQTFRFFPKIRHW